MIFITGCSKSGFHIEPDLGSAIDQYVNKPELRITAQAPDYFGNAVSHEEMQSAIAAPALTKLKLTYRELGESVKDIEWYIDGALIGKGNNIETTIADIGNKKLKLSFKNAENTPYTKEISLKVYRNVYAQLSLQNLPEASCGDVEIVGGTKLIPVKVDCQKRSLVIDEIIFSVNSYTALMPVAYVTADNRFPRMLMTISPGSIGNFKTGTYKVGENTVTILQ